MRKTIFLTLICLLFAFSIEAQQVTQGGLEAVGAGGKPLGAEISAFENRVSAAHDCRPDNFDSRNAPAQNRR